MIQFGMADAGASAKWIGHRNLIHGTPVTKANVVTAPAAGYARLDFQFIAAHVQAKDRLESRPMQPPGRSGVPGPTAARRWRRLGVNVRRHRVRLELVALDIGGRRRVQQRITEIEYFLGAIAIAQPGK